MNPEKVKQDRTTGAREKEKVLLVERVQAKSHLEMGEESRGAKRYRLPFNSQNPDDRPFVDTNELNRRYVDSENVKQQRRDGESLVRVFMADRSMSETCEQLAEKVDDFCGPGDLEDCPPDHEVFLLDDRCCVPGREGQRPNPGPLTPQSFCEHLSQPVSEDNHIKSIMGECERKTDAASS